MNFFDCDLSSGVCPSCGFVASGPGVKRNCPASAAPPRPGLGDYIAAGLDAVGITKERVQALASKVGIKDCGCGKRQEIANELGAKYLGIGQKPS